jgi:thioredoxin reductase
MTIYKAAVIGGGPAGLAAALAASKGGKVLLIEREARLGGILKQCVHDGFGVIRFGEKLSGCEYAQRFIDEVRSNKEIDIRLLTYVIGIKKNKTFHITATSSSGIETYEAENLILANGCRERTARQVNIHGTRPAGVMTAGVAQNFVNLLGVLPGKRCVILGSGDIGLIMARRLTLEGAEVLGVYEAKNTPSGLTRNISQCLNDFNIPLHLSATVKRVFGNKRVEAVEICKVTEKMEYIRGTEEILPCDTLIVSVGLIPENELAESLSVEIDPRTRGPVVDQNMQTMQDGVYSVGNALHVHDLVDYVSETAETAGKALLQPAAPRELVKVDAKGFLYLVPQRLDLASIKDSTVFYFRTAVPRKAATLTVRANGQTIYARNYTNLKPPEMEKISIPLKPRTGEKLEFILSDKEV